MKIAASRISPVRTVNYFHGVAGEVDEDPFARRMHLAQRRLQPFGPFAVQVAEPGVAKSVLAASFASIFLPEQRQRHVRPPQLAMHHRPGEVSVAARPHCFSSEAYDVLTS